MNKVQQMPTIKVTILLHLVEENICDILKIDFDEPIENASLKNEIKNDLSVHGDIVQNICNFLWSEQEEERNCLVEITLFYKTLQSSFGIFETDVDIGTDFDHYEWNEKDLKTIPIEKDSQEDMEK